MQLIYQNFDGLDVSYQGALPLCLLEELETAKKEAQESRKETVIRLGPKKLLVSVAETGAKGGYSYRFDTGPDGETWFVAHSDNPRLWNIRVSVKSLNLALNGYARVKQRLAETLADLGARGLEPSKAPKERVSRFDYCFDFILSNFQPNPSAFIAHPNCCHRIHNRLDESEHVLRGRRIESLTIGKMPGRQIIIYDKIREIRKRDKLYWWDLWGLDKTDFPAGIWRIEVRAGKKELDNWNVRSFDDFERRAGNVVKLTLEAIRLTEPNSDSNPSRWPYHPIWETCLAAADNALAAYSSKAERKKVINDLRANVLDRFRKLFPGLMASYSSLNEMDISELPALLDKVCAEVTTYASQNQQAITEKFLRAEERYLFLK